MLPIPHFFQIILVFITGAILGSFFNVLIYRLPRRLSVVKPGSFCPHCKNPVKWYHNIPLFSYLFLKGRCAYCREKISPRYFLVELITALLFTLFYLKFPFKKFIVTSSFFLFLIPVFFIDLEHQIIPDELSFGLIFSGWLFAFLGLNSEVTLLESLGSTFIGIGVLFFINEIYYYFTSQDGIGAGDFKLLGGIGAYLGYKSFFSIIFLASFIGLLVYGVYFFYLKIGREKKTRQKFLGLKTPVPFGSLLALGALFYLLDFKFPYLINF